MADDDKYLGTCAAGTHVGMHKQAAGSPNIIGVNVWLLLLSSSSCPSRFLLAHQGLLPGLLKYRGRYPLLARMTMTAGDGRTAIPIMLSV